jgi:glucosyl-dolichyl phosphate glucuronosyltransferase
MSLKASVVVCTYNRDQFIGAAIDSLERQTLDSNSFEIIVVNNSSTDETARILEDRLKYVSNLRCVVETKQGLSYARNRGTNEARAPLVAFLDDDAYADKNWIANIVMFFKNSSPHVAAAGGKCLAVWNADIPTWLFFSGASGPLAVMNYGEDVQNITQSSRVLFGANMAFRREALLAAGGFDTQLGRIGKKLLSGEDSVIQWRLDDLGYERWYCPQICVWHNVPIQRMTKEYHYRWYVGFGMSWAMMRQYKKRQQLIMRVGIVVWIILRMIVSSYMFLAWVFPCPEKYRFRNWCWWLTQWGYLKGAMGWI